MKIRFLDGRVTSQGIVKAGDVCDLPADEAKMFLGMTEVAELVKPPETLSETNKPSAKKGGKK